MIDLIYGTEITIEELLKLNQLGFEFVIEDGEIKDVIY